MPRTTTSQMIEFLDGLHEWIARGLPACDYGVPSGTITYRLNTVDLKAVRAVGLVSKSDGTPYPVLKERGEIVASAREVVGAA